MIEGVIIKKLGKFESSGVLPQIVLDAKGVTDIMMRGVVSSIVGCSFDKSLAFGGVLEEMPPGLLKTVMFVAIPNLVILLRGSQVHVPSSQWT